MIKLRGIIFFVLLIFILPPLTARADIGVSPSRLILTILPDSESRQVFHLTRSGKELDKDLKVNVKTDSPYIDLGGKDNIVLPAGEQESGFIFTIKSPNLELGEHEAIIYFTPDIQKPGLVGNGVKYVLGARVEFKVVNKIEEDINATLMPQDKFVQFGKIEASTFIPIGERTTIKSSLKNSSDNSLTQVPYQVEVYKGGVLVSSLKTAVGKSLPAKGALPIEYSFLPVPPKIGRYVITFSNKNYKESKTIIVLPTFSYLYDVAGNIARAMSGKLMAWWLNR
jgi:hypothetical protein